MPRPVSAPLFRSLGAGEGRGCQEIIAAARSITASARGSVRPCRRNAIASIRAAAASSSVKLSTAKTLPIFSGARRLESLIGVLLNNLEVTRRCGIAYGGSRFCVVGGAAGRGGPAGCPADDGPSWASVHCGPLGPEITL